MTHGDMRHDDGDAPSPITPAAPSVAEPRPAPAGALIGRDRDVAAVLGALGRSRLLTLLGPGGVGKTRLALRVADEAQERFPDGVAVVYLAALADAALVLTMVARALGVRERGSQPLREQVQQALGARRLLLVMDNFEQVVTAAPEVAELLGRCPQLTVLVTSRVPLGLEGESHYRVDPLMLPDPAVAPTVEAVEQASAAQLFVQRARAVAPEFALTPSNAAGVAALCRRLDGLPLAIELTAAQLALLSVPTLMARLDEALPLLAGEAHAFPERHQTMWRAIAWSYHLLAEREQALFRQLAVFVGGCTLEAVGAVCPAVSDGVGAASLAVSALVNQSLLMMDERPGREAPRLMMLETIRAYALERLTHSGEEDACRRQHALHYLALAEQAAPALTGPDQGLWMARLEQEHDNLRAVLRWTLAGTVLAASRADSAAPQPVPRVSSAERIALGLRLGAALWRFWYMHGYLSEGRDWLERLAVCPAGDDAASRGARARVLTRAGLLAVYQGDRDRAAVLCSEGLPLFESLGDQRGMAEALFGLGRLEDSVALYRQVGEARDLAEPLLELAMTAFQQGDDARATQLYEESLALARDRDDGRGVALALGGLGLVESFRRGNFRYAAELHEESLLLYRELGDTRGIAIALSNLGEVASMSGDYARATVLIEASLPLRREVGDQFGLADSLHALAEVARSQGDYRRAEALHEDSVGLFRKLGDKRWLTYPLRGLAEVLRLKGAYGRACAMFEELLAVSEEIGDKHGQAYALDGLGLVAAAQGDEARAQTLHEDALALYRAVEDRMGIPGALSHLGMVALQQGDPARAAALQRESLALYRALDDKRGIATVLCRLGDAMWALGAMEQARTLYSESLALSHQLGLKAELARGLAGMAAVAAAESEAEVAARLVGAADALREAIGAAVPPVERAAGERMRAGLRAALGADAFAVAWGAGRALAPEQAIAAALGGIPETEADVSRLAP